MRYPAEGSGSADATHPWFAGGTVTPLVHSRARSFVNVGTLGAVTGKRDLLVEVLTRRSADLEAAGCLFYEVGVNDEQPDTVFVADLWTSADAHQRSLQLESVPAAIQEARPLLSGEMNGFRFEVVGSPLRD